MKPLYNIFVSLLIFGMKIGALFSYKLKRGLAGRRQSCERVKEKILSSDRVIWMHAASLGEYEQGLPVLEKLKEKFPSHKILITFFSPSGYENVVNKNHIADVVCYLPFDLPKWISEFASHFQTDIFFTVKYDYWYNLLEYLKNRGTKVYVISALFYENQVFFSTYGGWFVNQLKKNIDWFFHQTRNSYGLAKTIDINQSSIAGDTRFDRVKQLRSRDNFVEFIDEFINGQQTAVLGSSWEAEERIAQTLSRRKDLKIIIAPHDLKRVETLKTNFPKAILYNNIVECLIKNDCNDEARIIHINDLKEAQVLIIDCIGLLSKLYSYADFAVVGGGFHSKGLHNILEAATFGIPVFFGNHYRKNPEADGLIANHGAKSFEDEFVAGNYILEALKKPEIFIEMGKKAVEFVDSQPHSTEIILKKILG